MRGIKLPPLYDPDIPLVAMSDASKTNMNSIDAVFPKRNLMRRRELPGECIEECSANIPVLAALQLASQYRFNRDRVEEFDLMPMAVSWT
jgi:hypothetical protein